VEIGQHEGRLANVLRPDCVRDVNQPWQAGLIDRITPYQIAAT